MDPSSISSGGGRILANVTESHFRGYVRAEEYWPEDSPEYKAGCEIENRKKPPHPEVPGDAFDRQRVMCGFDQGLIERQVCLVLGTGGIGMDVALTLARLGVGKIILVDRDTYDASNVTRQCLGSPADVGLRKVDVAARTLRQCHSIRSQVETIHCDAILEWQRIVEAARRSTVVFNGIDVGVMFDYCVNNLCKELGIPLVCGQSFAWKFMAEFYTGQDNQVCAFCHDSLSSTFGATDATLHRKPGSLLVRLESFLSDDSSNVAVKDMEAFLATDRQFLCSGGARTKSIIEKGFARAGLDSLPKGEILGPALVSFLRGFQAEVVSQLLPGNVSRLLDVAFIPRPKHADTRFIGSWICPCMGCAVMMVSQWSAWMTSEVQNGQPRNPPQTITFNLDTGMSGEEQMGYELGELGVAPNKAERRFCCDPSNSECGICSAAAALRSEEQLFVGHLPIVLSPVPGIATAQPATWCEPPAHDSKEYADAKMLALSRREPLGNLGEEYANVIVPAMPAIDWLPSREAEGAGSADWPPELSMTPMLKVPPDSEFASAPSAIRGVASGVRSAMVKARGQWWRLKGCGNRDQGFPVEVKGDAGELNVRGCCFEHTANTELRMTDLASKALGSAGLDCANVPAGSYCYTSLPEWPLPKVSRYCAVFRSLGNMRLGDHLLAGILKLLTLIFKEPEGGFSALRAALAAGRNADASDLWGTDMVASCGMPTADIAKELAAAGDVLEELPLSANDAEALAIPINLRGVWNKACDELREGLSEGKTATKEPSLLMWFAWRLGWECGATIRALHNAGIAWGTYPDAMGIHCNAHVNNMVIKPPTVGNPTMFLAALDFDMAFTSANFLPEASASRSSMGLNCWEDVLNFEATMGMKTVLAGSDFTSTGVANSTAVPETHSVVEMAMRDTLVAAYDTAREGGTDAHPHQDALRSAAYALVKLALCTTTHVEG